MTMRTYIASAAVVICTRDRPELLDRCLAAVFRQDYPKLDVLVVDNMPKDARSWEIAKRWGVRYIMEPAPGLSRGRNCGARSCNTEIIAYVDDDAIPERGWLSSLAREFEDPLVMAVTGQIRALSMENDAERLHAMIGRTKLGGEERRAIDSASAEWFEMANFGGIGNGGNMAFRRSAFEIWPGFDERLGRGALLDGGEEHYAFFSLIDRGYRIVYTPRAVVWHPYPSTRNDIQARYLKDLADSTGYMTLLFMEEPRYRRATMKYIIGGIRGVERTWRYPSGGPRPPRPRIVRFWRTMLAYLSGPLLYIRLRLAGQWKGVRGILDSVS